MNDNQTSVQTVWSSFQGASALGPDVHLYYGQSVDADVALAFVIADGQMPRMVYWGKALRHPERLVDAYDALRPQRV
ncbi:MAG: hypothetical protein L0K70_01850, partial [Bifidobacterium crudilactis]|nr:hypothetical protein [Bifidobacterium crudilactis]